MLWWLLTLLYNLRAWTTLYTLAWTNRDAHLFMAWANYKPARHKVYKNVRGVQVHCGYRWIWDTPNIAEQTEPGDTYTHTFLLRGLNPTDHLWYYLFSPAPDLSRQCQGPLIHIQPPEVPMISARVFHSANQNLPGLATTVATFDSELWDDADFHSGANPTRLTIPVTGRYLVGASTHFLAGGATGLRIRVRVNGVLQIGGHTAWIAAGGWADVDLSLTTLYQFAAADYLELLIYNTHLNARTLEAMPNYSPHFWAIYQGPLP